MTVCIGIGHAIATKLLSENANVVVQARNLDESKKLQDDYPDQYRSITGDMGDITLPKRVVEFALKEFGELNGVIINHGTMDPVHKIVDSDIQEWRQLFDVNFFSAVAFVSTNELRRAPSLTMYRQRLPCHLCARAKAVFYSPLPVSRQGRTAAGERMELPKQQ